MPDSRAVRALLSLGMVASIGATSTYAYWTDQVTVSGTVISTGTIDLRVNNLNTVTGYTTMNVSNMVPGDSTAGVVQVNNSGTAPLRYWADAAASNADGKGLGSNLTIKVTNDQNTGTSGSSKTCPGTSIATATGFGANMIASAASGRLLAAGASEWVCIQATLPAAAGSNLQGATTNVTFTFNGTSF